MTDNLIMILLYVGAAVFVAKMYREDYLGHRSGEKKGNPLPPEQHAMPRVGDRSDEKGGNPLPGATACSLGAIVIGLVGALLILGVETGGEIVLGIVSAQSEIVWYAVFAIVAAGIVEEVIFRGFLVVDKKGRAALIGSCVGFSLLFAIIHGHFWSFEDGFEWTFTTKAWFTTGILFANSIWFYALRFGPWNRGRSIFPCMIAHAASNLGVFAIKLAQGYVIW